MAAVNKKRAYSINNLQTYTPYFCTYSVAVYAAWYWYWNVQSNLQNECTTIEICPKYAQGPPDKMYVQWGQAAAVCFGLSSIAQLLQLGFSDKSHMQRLPSYCAICDHLIAAATHAAIAYDVLPVLISPFGRIAHIARFGEWIALVPLLVVMIHSLDIRDEFDTKLLFIAAATMQASALIGVIGSIISNYVIAVLCEVVSCILYCLIFYDVARASWRLNEYRHLEKQRGNEVNKKLNKEGIIKSFYLTLSFCLCCSYVVVVYFCGIAGVISHVMEFQLQTVGDVVLKLVYVYILSAEQVNVIAEEHLLHAIKGLREFFSSTKRLDGRPPRKETAK